jgi:hypothetical protein
MDFLEPLLDYRAAESRAAFEMLLMLARHYTDAVLAGHNKATRPAVEAPTLNLAFCDSLTNATLIEEADTVGALRVGRVSPTGPRKARPDDRLRRATPPGGNVDRLG